MKREYRLLLERAATASLDRIRRDGEKAPGKLKMLFPYLEEHLFDRPLDVNQMRRDCEIRDNSFSLVFEEVTGQHPHAYIVEQRVETAAALLRDTALRIVTISKLTGFSHHVVLTRNFKAFYGITPQAFREGGKKIFAEAGCRTAGFPSVGELRTALIHGLESEQVRELTLRIRQHNARESTLPSLPKCQEPQEPFLTKEKRLKAEEAWEVLRERPWADQLNIIRNCQTFSTPEFCRFLLKKSIPEGRNNRELGVHIAELALECLKLTEHALGKDLFHLRAQGWVWLGNARRLADDLNGAEAAFSIAGSYLEKERMESLVHAEYYREQSRLRLWQGRAEEACTLHGRALPLFRQMGTPKDIAASLIEGAYAYERTGNDEKSIAHLREALQLLNGETDPYLEFAACFNLTSAYIRIGAIEEAKMMLPRVRVLRESAHAEEASLHFLQWLEGRLTEHLGEFSAAEGLYEAARAGFLKLGQTINAALVSLDFALHCWEQDRLTEVRELTLGIIPLLEAIQFHQEAAAGLKLLQSAIEKSELTREVLQETRDYLEGIRFEPWS